MRNTIRLNESTLHKIIKESVKRVLKEGGNLYLINGNMCKLADAGIFAGGQAAQEPTSEEPPPENRKRGKR